MRIELPIIDEPDTGLCTIADLAENGEMSKILISTGCGNNYISEALYNRLEHKNPQSPHEIKIDSTAFYPNDLTGAKAGVIKFLRLPGYTFTDVPVIVTSSFPAYQCDMILGIPIISAGWFTVDYDCGLVIIQEDH